jgi:hypothetical protein
MRTANIILSVAACIGLASPTAAAPPKPPWTWSPQERAAARRDPQQRLARLQADERAHGGRRSALSRPATADVIDGNTSPELFFETELFEYLVRSSFVTLPGIYPKVVRSRTGLFRTPEDWDRFAAIAAPYAQVLKDEQTAANAADRAAVTAIQARKCAAEARALRAARRAFGASSFDRMLYEAVPPGMLRTYSIDTDFETSTNSALGREERCQ